MNKRSHTNPKTYLFSTLLLSLSSHALINDNFFSCPSFAIAISAQCFTCSSTIKLTQIASSLLLSNIIRFCSGINQQYIVDHMLAYTKRTHKKILTNLTQVKGGNDHS